MFSVLKNKTMPIGLDVGSSSVRMIQMGCEGGGIEVIGAEETLYDADAIGEDGRVSVEYIVESIRDMLCRGDFCGREVVSSLPSDAVKIKSLRVDSIDEDNIDELIRTDIASRFGLDAERDEIRYIDAGSIYQGDDVKREVIFFGAARGAIAEHISLIEDAGLKPVGLDTMPCSLFRSFQNSLRRQEDMVTTCVFVNVGNSCTTVIIGKGHQIRFVKQIPIAGMNMNAQVAEKLGIDIHQAGKLRAELQNGDDGKCDPATRQAVIDAIGPVIENLAKEISLCFSYYAVSFRGERPCQAVFTGGEAYEVSLLNAIKRHVDVEIKVAQPLRGFDLSKSNFTADRRRPSLCEWAVAVGLSVKGLKVQEMGTASNE